MDHKARVEESKNTTVDDLTRGIINYKYLGFDFVKAKGNGLRYVKNLSHFSIHDEALAHWRGMIASPLHSWTQATLRGAFHLS